MAALVFREPHLEFVDAPCPPIMTAHALSMLMIAITTTHFDLIRTMAMLDVWCQEITEGQYDQYKQMPSSVTLRD
jgi:hypothetical protein